MKFMVATIALFCVLAYANAGLPRSGGPPRSTGPHNPRGGFRFRRDVEHEESIIPQEQALHHVGTHADLPAGVVRLSTDMDPEDQVIPYVYGLNAAYRHRRNLADGSFDEEEDVY